MAKKHWMKDAVKHPGALTKKASSAGESPMEFAHEHYHDSGQTGEQARFAVNAQKRAGGGAVKGAGAATRGVRPAKMC